MNRKLPLALLVALTIFLLGLEAAAQEDSKPQAMIERLFEAPQIKAAWFAPEFLAQVSADQVEDIVAAMEKQHGPFQSVSGEGQDFTVMLERAEVPTQLALDAEGRIAGLFFAPPVAVGDLAQQIEAIAALPGRTSVLVTSDDEPQAEHDADTPLAVGSAAKLAILKAVDDAVAQDRLSWDQVVTLDEAWRSLPTGQLQNWPEGTPVTIATLANLMISISDNTATDALIHLVGREKVEAVTPRNIPFLTTRELFNLKASGKDEPRKAWIEGDEAARRGILDRIADEPLPEVGSLEVGPTLETEWFLSARELCELIEELAEVPALGINPGLASPEDWEAIAFKGGSEPGVLNYTTRLVAPDGAVHCVSASWNNAEAGLDEQMLASSYRAILRVLRQE